MKKHLISLMLLVCITLALAAPVFAAPSASTIVDSSILLAVNSPLSYVQGKQGSVDPNNPAVMPLIVDNRTLVPVRFIAESLNMNVDWDQATRTALISSVGYDIRITLDSKTMYVNGSAVELDVPARAHEGRTLVPVRAISEALKKDVFYYNNLIIISSGGFSLDTNDKETQELLDQLREELFPKVKITYAGQVGEINGVTYAIRDVPGLATLPVGASSFCYYDGYVYYAKRDRAGTSDYSTWLYRCKPDWTGEVLLSSYGSSYFVIDNGILYANSYCIDLSTLETDGARPPVHSVEIGGKTYKSTDRNYSMYIYDDVYTVYFSKTKKLYTVGDSETLVLSGVRASTVGAAGGYLYYSTEEPSTDPNYAGFADGCLYRVPIGGGTPELIDRHVTAGSGGYFNY